MSFAPYRSWHDVMKAARAGEPLFYQAPMDARPTRFVTVGESPTRDFTYEVKALTIRLRPPKHLADPFTANGDHLERFRRELSEHAAIDAHMRADPHGDLARARARARDIDRQDAEVRAMREARIAGLKAELAALEKKR